MKEYLQTYIGIAFLFGTVFKRYLFLQKLAHKKHKTWRLLLSQTAIKLLKDSSYNEFPSKSTLTFFKSNATISLKKIMYYSLT